MGVFQMVLPSLSDAAMRQHLPSISPIVKILPSAITRLEKPPPKPLALQASGGPSPFHESSRPFSLDTPSRLGPRQLGQLVASFFVSPSDAKAVEASAQRKTVVTSEQLMRGIVMVGPSMMEGCGIHWQAG